MNYKNASIDQIEKELRDKLLNNIITGEKDGRFYFKSFKKGLVIYNSVTGTGKTFSMYAIANYVNARVLHTIEMFDEMKDKIQSGNLKSYIDYITEGKYIFIDDLGAETKTDFTLEKIFQIVDRCSRLDKTLFISTNLTFEELTAKYGERVMSRIVGMCDFYKTQDIDRRLTKE